MARIGFIGLGHMGTPMVRNLLKHQHNVTVYDVLPQAVKALETLGAVAASSLKAMVQNADVLITMLPAGKDVVDICTREDGIFGNAHPGTLIINSSSIEIGFSRTLAAQAKAKELSMLDAPVSGGPGGATAGILTFMVGGSVEDYERAKSILECMGKAIIYAGPAGNGQAAKICNNMILGISMIAVSEAFVLAKRLGLDAQTFFNISTISSGQCWAMTNCCPVPGLVLNTPANYDYKPGFSSAMMLKDLQHSQEAAQSVQLVTPLGQDATALYEQFNREGNAQVDFSGIIKMIEEK